MTREISTTEIIAVGSELTRGEVADTNSTYISQALARIGIQTCFHSTVGDVPSHMVEVITSACRRADIVMVTGGLGPTGDDITRQVIASYAGRKLVQDRVCLEHVKAFFKQHRRQPTDNNLAQAMIPEGATVIPNPRGTAPGFTLKVDSALVIALPGVPAEMKSMLEETVLPHLVKLGLGGGITLTRKLHMFGTGESSIDSKIRQWLDPKGNPSIGITVSGGIITITIAATAPDQAAALALIQGPENRIRDALGKLVFGTDDDTLQQTTARLLIAEGLTLATAESCTGGLLTSMLAQTPGVSASLLGGIVAYSNEVKTNVLGISRQLISEKGAVSSEVAKAMAEGARMRLDADLGIAITGIAGPEGGTPTKPVGLVYIALTDGQTPEAHEFRFRGSRDDIRSRAACTALNILRLHLCHRHPSSPAPA